MPCPHFDVKIIQRSKRQSAVASAAYQSGERLFSEYDQKQKYYGWNRPWNGPNQWCAAPDDPEPAVTLRWPRPQILKELRLYLDPELCAERPSSYAAQWQDSHKLTLHREMPAQLARDILVEVSQDGTRWEPVSELQDNRKRMVTVALPERQGVQALRIRFTRMWGDRPAAVFAVNLCQA